MKFTKTHEWIEMNGDIGTVGVTNYAQSQLGDIVYVELPELNRQIKQGDEVAVLESTKAAADVYSPVTGTILEINQALKEQAELINTAAETQGWLFKIKLQNLYELDSMMDLMQYQKATGS